MSPPSENSLRPLPYHEALANFLQTQEPATWRWFESAQAQASYADNLRLDLLKQTYRLDPATHVEAYAALADAQQKLGLETLPGSLYQSQGSTALNALLCYLPGELHVVFEGGVLQLLDARELRSVLGHELAHFVLWNEAERRYLVTDRAILAMAGDPRGEVSHAESARLWRLHTEIYADRGSLLVTGDIAPVISGLVKIATGLAQVDAASYVQQANEIFARAKIRTEGISHPELFIRARALALWAEGAPDVEAEIKRMIEGPPTLDRLDLVAQQQFTRLTRRWMHELLRPGWFHTAAVRAQARLFFEDFDPAASNGAVADNEKPLAEELRDADTSVRDYFCYVLLDFAAVDPELELQPLREGFILADRIDWGDRLETLATKELKLKKREVQKVREEAQAAAGGPAA